jgi:3-isopropylmalate dehydrogenase
MRLIESIAPRGAASVENPPAGRLLGVFPGEGIGPEVIGAALHVLDALETVRPLRIQRVTGGPIGLAGSSTEGNGELNAQAAAFCRRVFDAGGAILCGPGGGRFVYDLRRTFDLFCKIAPLRPAIPLSGAARFKPEVLRDVDILIVRENVGGIYQGSGVDRLDPRLGRVVEHSFAYTQPQVRRIIEVGVRLAGRRRRRLHVILKDGGIPAISALWRQTAESLAVDVACTFMNADYAAYQMLQHPGQFDVVVTPNMIGDMLADSGAVLLGSRGLSYSANFSAEGRAVYQTGHGSAHDLAGADRANPAAQILSLAMLLRESYACTEEARFIERALEEVWLAGWRTDDLMQPGCRRAGTQRMGQLVARAVVALAKNEVAA